MERTTIRTAKTRSSMDIRQLSVNGPHGVETREDDSDELKCGYARHRLPARLGYLLRAEFPLRCIEV